MSSPLSPRNGSILSWAAILTGTNLSSAVLVATDNVAVLVVEVNVEVDEVLDLDLVSIVLIPDGLVVNTILSSRSAN